MDREVLELCDVRCAEDQCVSRTRNQERGIPGAIDPTSNAILATITAKAGHILLLQADHLEIGLVVSQTDAAIVARVNSCIKGLLSILNQ